MKQPNFNHYQSGATILLFVVIMTVIIILLLTTYLVILTRSTRNSYNQARSEISYSHSLGTLNQSIIKHIKDPENIWGVDFNISSFSDTLTIPNSTNPQDTIIDRDIYKDGSNINFDILATTSNNPRTYQGVYTPPVINNPPTDIYLVLDISDSMNEPATQGSTDSKLSGAKAAAKTFIQEFSTVSTSQIGIITFGTNATKQIELSPTHTNQSNLISTINSLSTNGSTNTSAALELANQKFNSYSASDPTKYVILLSDGIPTVDNSDGTTKRCIEQPNEEKANCMIAAYSQTQNQAAQLHINNDTNVISIAYGSSQVFPNQIDTTNLKSLSYNQKTGTTYYYHAPDTESLESIFREIAIEIITPAKLSIDEITP